MKIITPAGLYRLQVKLFQRVRRENGPPGSSAVRRRSRSVKKACGTPYKIGAVKGAAASGRLVISCRFGLCPSGISCRTARTFTSYTVCKPNARLDCFSRFHPILASVATESESDSVRIPRIFPPFSRPHPDPGYYSALREGVRRCMRA